MLYFFHEGFECPVGLERLLFVHVGCLYVYMIYQYVHALVFVSAQGARPDIPSICPADLANVMRQCWDPKPENRPNMTEVVAMLEAVDPKGKALGPRTSVLKKNSGCGCM